MLFQQCQACVRWLFIDCVFSVLSCSDCACPLTSWYCQRDGLLYCKEHYQRRYDEACNHCMIRITGPVMVSFAQLGRLLLSPWLKLIVIFLHWTWSTKWSSIEQCLTWEQEIGYTWIVMSSAQFVHLSVSFTRWLHNLLASDGFQQRGGRLLCHVVPCFWSDWVILWMCTVLTTSSSCIVSCNIYLSWNVYMPSERLLVLCLPSVCRWVPLSSRVLQMPLLSSVYWWRRDIRTRGTI